MVVVEVSDLADFLDARAFVDWLVALKDYPGPYNMEVIGLCQKQAKGSARNWLHSIEDNNRIMG